MGGQACPLGAQRVLGYLNHDLLSLSQQGVDLLDAALGIILVIVFAQDIRGMQKGGTLQTDIDEGRLHPGQHAADPASIDIADQAALAGTLNMHLLQDAVLDEGDTGLLWGDIDQQLFAHKIQVSGYRYQITGIRPKVSGVSCLLLPVACNLFPLTLNTTIDYTFMAVGTMPNCPNNSAVSNNGNPITPE